MDLIKLLIISSLLNVKIYFLERSSTKNTYVYARVDSCLNKLISTYEYLVEPIAATTSVYFSESGTKTKLVPSSLIQVL